MSIYCDVSQTIFVFIVDSANLVLSLLMDAK